MRGVAVFEEKNSLPGSELHFSTHNRDGLARSRQNHADVGGHVIAAFRAVRKIISTFWHQSVEEFLEVAPRGWIGIFHNNYAATGVLNKDRDRPVAQTAFVDLALNFVGNLVRAFAICLDREVAHLNVHRSNPPTLRIRLGRLIKIRDCRNERI